MAKKQPRKIAKIELTPHEREVIAEGVNSEFFKIIEEKILPQRRVQISLTAIEADQSMEDIWYHRGMLFMCQWLPKFMNSETENMDLDRIDNDDDSIDAEDEILPV